MGAQLAGGGCPVEPAVAAEVLQGDVGPAVGLGGRGEDVAAPGEEVDVAGGQVAAALVGAEQVQVQAAAGGLHAGGDVVQQPGPAQLAEGGVAVLGRAAGVDVQDVGAGGAGGDG